jgi:precorrin-6B methylase 2
VSAATIESAVEARACLSRAGWVSELVQIAVSRGREIGGRTRLDPLGPVFVVTGWRVDAIGGSSGCDEASPVTTAVAD